MNMEKCKFYKNERGDIFAVSSFAGKTIRGVAKCNPQDSYDEDFGKQLAAYRCELKVAEARRKRAYQKHDEAAAEVAKAQKFLERMAIYEADAEATFNQCQLDYEAFMAAHSIQE